mgnify:CR=1 FL=1
MHRTEEVLTQLTQLPAFRLWPAEAQLRLAVGARIVSVSKGKQILACGDPVSELIVVLGGTVVTSRTSEDGRQSVLFHWHKGDILGMSPILSGGRFSFDLSAQTRSRLLCISAGPILSVLAEQPHLLGGVVDLLCGHYRLTIDMFCRQALMPLRARLIDRLLFLAKAHGVSTSAGVRLAMRLSQSELAAMLSSSRQSVNKELQLLVQRGLLALAYNSITITDMAGLMAQMRPYADTGERVEHLAPSPLASALSRAG